MLITLPALFFLDSTQGEKLAIVAVSVAVLVVELLNSAIEAVVDRIGSEQHALSGAAKDAGSAAVLLTLLLWGGLWIAFLARVYL